MAARFDAAADRLIRTANNPSTAGPWTWIAWVYKVSNTGGGYQLIHIPSLNGTFGNNPFIYSGNVGTAWVLGVNAGENSAGTVAIATWYAFVQTRDESLGTDMSLYIDDMATPIVTLNGVETGTVGQWEVGGDDANERWDGRVAGIKLWDVVLSQAEREAEIAQLSPVRTSNLQGFYPLENDFNDYSGLGRHFTQEGTVTFESGPPIPYGGIAPRSHRMAITHRMG